MELLDRLTQSITAKGRLLKEMAAITGRMQGLVNRLERHAEGCVYPQMKQRIERVAAESNGHVKALNAILSGNRVWSALPERTAHEGINTWERASGDLVALGRLNVELNQHAVRWMAVDADISERLRTIVSEQVPLIDELQEVVARSDPQAID